MSAKKRGRPEIELDLEILQGLCEIGCTNKEIAAVFGCSERTIDTKRKNAQILLTMDRGEALGNVSLRRAQHKKAMRGCTQMLKWLGIQRLGQKDRIAQEHSGEISGPPPKIYVNFVKPNSKEQTGTE